MTSPVPPLTTGDVVTILAEPFGGGCYGRYVKGRHAVVTAVHANGQPFAGEEPFLYDVALLVEPFEAGQREPLVPIPLWPRELAKVTR